MARNRKRARDRRERPPESARVVAPVGLAAGSNAANAANAANGQNGGLENAPAPLMHATPDAELADAQVALGRPDLADVPDAQELEEFEEAEAEADAGRAATGVTTRRPSHVAEPSASLPARLIGFLRGSWLELHRVQWPDRRQVMQATGVVIGFVIVAGVFLGVADLISSKLVNLIIK